MKNLKLLSKPIRILYDRFVKNNPNALAIALVEELIKENLKLKRDSISNKMEKIDKLNKGDK